jgi:hypothetical protein
MAGRRLSRSEIVKRYWAGLTPEQRSARNANISAEEKNRRRLRTSAWWAKQPAEARKERHIHTPAERAKIAAAKRKWWAKFTPEQRRAINRARAAKVPTERKSDASKKSWAKIPEKKRKEIQKAGTRAARAQLERLTLQERTEMRQRIGASSKKAWAEMAPEKKEKIKKEISARQRKYWSAMTSEERSAIIRRIWNSMPAEKRRERSRKGWTKLTPEQRHERALQMAAGISSTKRSARMKKAHKTRRTKLLKDVLYVDELPKLKILTPSEVNQKFGELEPLLVELATKFRKRPDYEQVQSEIHFATILALAKWDRQVSLEKLVQDSVKLQLIRYFAGAKRERRNRTFFED